MITTITRDTQTLPNALLEACKKHERIKFCDDDELLQDKIAMAIERFEIKTEIGIFQAQYTWTPDEWSNGRVKVPRVPVLTWAALVGAVDVSAGYTISSAGFGGEIAAAYLAGTWQSGLALTIATGFTPQTLPVGIKDIIFRIAGHLYEYREIYVLSNINQQSLWIDDLMAGYWQPRA